MENQDIQSEETPASEAVGAFFGQFGKIDIYTQIVLEEFLKGLLNEK